MLSEEEKKAIKYFYNLRSTIDESYMLFDEEINLKCGKEMIKQITLALNLITKLQKENKEKDNQIDLMTETIRKLAIALANYKGSYDKETINLTSNTEEIKQYFERKSNEI